MGNVLSNDEQIGDVFINSQRIMDVLSNNEQIADAFIDLQVVPVTDVDFGKLTIC